MALIIGIGFAFVALCDFILIVKVSSAAAVTRDQLRLSGSLRNQSGSANSRPLSLIYPAAFTQYFPLQPIVLPLCVISLSPNHHHHHHHLCVIFCHLSSVCLIRPVSQFPLFFNIPCPCSPLFSPFGCTSYQLHPPSERAILNLMLFIELRSQGTQSYSRDKICPLTDLRRDIWNLKTSLALYAKRSVWLL